MLLTLIRHGESIANAKGQLAGSPFAPLSERGKAQAEALADFLSDGTDSSRIPSSSESSQRSCSYDALISSDRPRAVQTCAPIALKLGLKPRFFPELRERDWGELAEKPEEEYQRLLHESGKPFFEFLPQGGESFCSLQTRVENFLSCLAVEYSEKSVIVIAHESVNKAALKVLLKYSWEDLSSLQQRNACVNLIQLLPGGRAEVLTLDSIDHLDRNQRNRCV